MKIRQHLLLFFSLFILLSACASPSNSNTNTDPGFVFTEDEVNENTDNEGASAQEDPNTIILEDEVIPAADNDLVPESGEWDITHDPGQTVCPDSVSFTFPGGDPETVFIGLSPEYQVTVSGTGMLDQLNLDMIDIGMGGAEFFTSIVMDGHTIDYSFIFIHLVDNQPYDYLEGTVTNEADGCKTTRTFYGTPID
ncbi:MAG: hypothetical protein HN392_12945 [Anaerolineae bacterium]|mgnify:CR=1 FL=1|jgi:hypothetical protein|nr:hypothetical protein [Anaerolineae bacterium]MBT7075600.1 hypothetical protein [Anaerolineae bacterium]MBT7782405.1 hypothetical protein [Anaerolineae bacterium]